MLITNLFNHLFSYVKLLVRLLLMVFDSLFYGDIVYKGPRTVSYSICPIFESLWLG